MINTQENGEDAASAPALTARVFAVLSGAIASAAIERF
jgi:hypothetical protein